MISRTCRPLLENKQTSTPPAGLEHAIPASQRPQTDTFDRAATSYGTQTYMSLFTRAHTHCNCPEPAQFTSRSQTILILSSKLRWPRWFQALKFTLKYNQNTFQSNEKVGLSVCEWEMGETFGSF
jgi:hypothetical protein